VSPDRGSHQLRHREVSSRSFFLDRSVHRLRHSDDHLLELGSLGLLGIVSGHAVLLVADGHGRTVRLQAAVAVDTR
jgi:hypothetical protein